MFTSQTSGGVIWQKAFFVFLFLFLFFFGMGEKVRLENQG